MNNIHFNIESWLALSPSLESKEQWRLWALADQEWPKTTSSLPVNEIPAVFRRRMSLLSKLAVQTALSLVKNNDIDFIVFSSRHGELHRTVKLLTDILHGEDASPMAFSQSVHNTAAGLLTIVSKKAIPATSLAAGEHSLHSALIEASAYLAENPEHRVLVVDFDQPLPEQYEEFDEMKYQAFSLGMVLTSGEQCHLSWQAALQANVERSEASLPQTLNVIAKLACDETSWQVAGQRYSWFWQC